MKRIFTLLFLSILCSLAATAQLRIGVVGGVQQSDILESNNLPNWNDIKQHYGKRTGGHFGFIADLPFNKKGNFVFQPGVIFYNKGRKYNEVMDTTFRDTLSVDRKEFINYIEIPFNLVGKIPLGKKAKFVLGGGTYFSFFYNGSVRSQYVAKNGAFSADEIDDLPVGDGPGKYSTYDFGVNALAGFEFGRVLLTAHYSRGLHDMYQSASYDGKFRNETMGIRLGVFLGKPVKVAGKDQDGDGVPDKKDKCPEQKGSPALDGCPDQDSDGIPDKDDTCPNVWGPAENKGCPWGDKDGDGVVDKDDKCPEKAGDKENNGCPWPDADGDAVPDKDDKCPKEKGLARLQGCPIGDRDKDGLNDEEDKCPDQPGTIANNGCPEIKKEIVEKVEYAAKRIQFRKNSALLATVSYKVLDEVVSLLKSNPDLKLTVEGHTSKEGAYEVNKRISEQRAQAVKIYLVQKGIEEVRINAIGYGPDKPLTTSDLESEQAKNRRVELKLSNQ
ncbi:MAG: OmpA family protein [Chitinophagaceae bacterium]